MILVTLYWRTQYSITKVALNMTNQKTLFSGIQPSGQLMIGNYIGALKNWVAMQDDYDCLFSIVDMHSITVRQDPLLLQSQCLDSLAIYLACGVDPKKSIIFIQSHVAQHTQLAWVLNCITAMGELNRMTQFKEKSKQHSANVNVGLFAYPVLMAADILLYGSHVVPVGDDQKQHMELARDLAQRFNHRYGEAFVVPNAYIPPQGARIMSLQDPSKKMSKSDPNQGSTVALLDSPEVILRKCKRAVTDSETEIRYDEAKKPGVSNLLTIFSAVTGQSISQLENAFKGQGYGVLKMQLGEAIVKFLTPIQARYQQIREDKTYLNQVMQQGAQAASERAEKMLAKVYHHIGFVPKSF